MKGETITKNRTKWMICTLIVGTMGLVNTPAMAATNNAIHENKTVFQGVTIIEKQSVSLPPSFTFSPATSSATYSDSTEFSLNTNEFGARSVFAGTTVEAETPGLTGRITGKYTAKVTSYYGTYSVATTANDSYSTI